MNHVQTLENRVLMSFGQLDPGFDLKGYTRLEAVDGAFTTVKHLPDNRILAAGHSEGRGLLAMYRADGRLDTSFGEGGLVQVTPAAITTITGLEVDTQNRIIVAGHVKFFVGDDNDLFVSAYTMTGQPVSGWGRTGAGTTFFDFLGWESGGALASTPDGGVVLNGTSASIVTTFGILKLDAFGMPDTNFGTTGYARVGPGIHARGTGIAVQTDGKVLAVGIAKKSNSDPYKFGAVRLNTDGSYDTSFAGDGKFLIEGMPGESSAGAVAIDSQGRIVIGGTARMDTTIDVAAARILPNGTLDTSFFSTGINTVNLGYDDFGSTVAVMRDNSVILAGWSENATGGTHDTQVVRFRENGSLDNTFNGSGISRRHFGGNEQLYAVTTTPDGGIIGAGAIDGDLMLTRYRGYLRTDFGDGGVVGDFGSAEPVILHTVTHQPDGKVIAAGYLFNVPGGPAGAFRIQRHLPDGSLDPTFGNNGIRDIDAIPTANDDGAIDVTVAPDGTIYALGMSWFDQADHWIVVALDSAGNTVNSFGGDGVVSFRPGGASFSTPAAIRVQPGGKLVVAGSIVPEGRFDRDITVVRLDPAGNLDSGFGASGVASIRIRSASGADGFDTAAGLALFENGAIAVAGTTSLDGGNMVAAVFTPAGQPDTSFAQAGWQILHDVPGNTSGNAIVIDPQGRLVLAGTSRPNALPYTQLAVVRLLRSGAFDNTFAGNGSDVLSLGNTINDIRGVGVMPNGKVVVTGSTNHGGTNSNILLARWNFNGSRDTRLTSLTPFATRAVASFDVEGRADYANGMTILPDGDVVVAGRSDFRGVVARFTSETTAMGAEFQVDVPRQQIVVQFNADVSTSLSPSDFVVVERDTLTLIERTVSYDPATNRAIVRFPTLPSGMLPDGRYRLSIERHAIQDSAGNSLASDFQLLFEFLNGDANRDGVVNLTDFNHLAANFGQTGRTFSQGDFNYDGVVNLSDFNILAARFGTTLGTLSAWGALSESSSVTDADQFQESLEQLSR